MIADKQIKELQGKVADVEKLILGGKLDLVAYKERCAQRNAYLEAIDTMRSIASEEED